MREYTVHCVDNVDWSIIEEQSINECRWSPNAAPAAGMKAAFLNGKGLQVLVKSYAAPARAENTLPDSSVWQDSCLEFFFSFDGEKYVNLEVNANSALRASIGTERHGRSFLKDMGIPMPQVKAGQTEDGWQVLFSISIETVKALWGCDVVPGDSFRANFYSCGDMTPAPHYASWSPIETEKPDFHRPEYFGLIKIEG